MKTFKLSCVSRNFCQNLASFYMLSFSCHRSFLLCITLWWPFNNYTRLKLTIFPTLQSTASLKMELFSGRASLNSLLKRVPPPPLVLAVLHSCYLLWFFTLFPLYIQVYNGVAPLCSQLCECKVHPILPLPPTPRPPLPSTRDYQIRVCVWVWVWVLLFRPNVCVWDYYLSHQSDLFLEPSSLLIVIRRCRYEGSESFTKLQKSKVMFVLNLTFWGFISILFLGPSDAPRWNGTLQSKIQTTGYIYVSKAPLLGSNV